MMARWGMIIITWERHKAINVPEHNGEEICMQNEITTEIPFEKNLVNREGNCYFSQIFRCSLG